MPWTNRLARAVALATALGATPVEAQDRGRGSERPAMERLRQRMAAVVRTRLRLTDDQMRRLGEVNRRFEDERGALFARERAARHGVRAEVLRGDSADQRRVERLLDEMLGIQRQRIDVVAREQRELASFMTPVQRAQYLALQDAMQRRVQEVRRGRGGRRGEGGGPPGGRGRPPG
ncbi:MAG TPA: Spy/CpxP family protein refolding chaperone [Gemmatimonadaceae bacterium]|nr:Spy/CpxP family protein refolding chaperone [Gemmatimonadaceae bacterium]